MNASLVSGPSSERPRVLIIAEAANPEWASVPLVGYAHARELSELVEAEVVTQVRNRDALERSGWTHGREFLALDTEYIAGPVWRMGEFIRKVTGIGLTFETALATLPYYEFERQVWRAYGDRIRRREFHLVHRVTPLSPAIPSIVAGRCRAAGVPFVWGPINGGVPWPSAFRAVRRQEGDILSYVRDAYKLLPGYASTRRNAAAILVGSCVTYRQIPERYRHACVYMPENAVDPGRFKLTSTPRQTRLPVRVAFVGRLVPCKAVDILLEASAELVRQRKLVIEIIGDGPLRADLERLTMTLNLCNGVTFTGWLKHAEVAERLEQADVFGFPSVREFGGGAVLEAMAVGAVPIVTNYAGPGELVSDGTGFRVPMGPRKELVEGFRRVLQSLAENPAALPGLSAGARRRVARMFTWRAKALQTLEVYRWVLGQRGKPDFGMPFRDESPAVREPGTYQDLPFRQL